MYFCSYVKDIYLFSRKGAKSAERYVLLFLCQKLLHAESTEIHRICSQFFRQKNIRTYFLCLLDTNMFV